MGTAWSPIAPQVVRVVLTFSQTVRARALSASSTAKHRRRSIFVSVAARLSLRRAFMAAAFVGAVFSATTAGRVARPDRDRPGSGCEDGVRGRCVGGGGSTRRRAERATEHRTGHDRVRITRRPAPVLSGRYVSGRGAREIDGLGAVPPRKDLGLRRRRHLDVGRLRRGIHRGQGRQGTTDEAERRPSTSPTPGSSCTTERRARSISGSSATRAISISGTSTSPTRTPSASSTPFSSGRTFSWRSSSRRSPAGS